MIISFGVIIPTGFLFLKSLTTIIPCTPLCTKSLQAFVIREFWESKGTPLMVITSPAACALGMYPAAFNPAIISLNVTIPSICLVARDLTTGIASTLDLLIILKASLISISGSRTGSSRKTSRTVKFDRADVTVKTSLLKMYPSSFSDAKFLTITRILMSCFLNIALASVISVLSRTL